MAYLRADYSRLAETASIRGVTHSSRLSNASALEMFTELVPDRPEWHAQANCKGAATGLFFSARGENAVVEKAKEVCRGCEVRLECLDYAMDTRQVFGIWGGLSENERRRIRRKRRVS